MTRANLRELSIESSKPTRSREIMVYSLPQQPSFSFLLGRDCQWRYLYRLMLKGEVPV
jgi:hypothetical protein